MNLIPLIIIYAIGFVGYCSFAFMAWKMWRGRSMCPVWPISRPCK